MYINFTHRLSYRADIYELQGRSQDALKWFNVLAARVNDPVVLTRLGELYNETNDETRALNYQLESFRHYPIDLDVISSIGTFLVKQEMYERSLYFFQQASLIQPNEIKWGMILASNHKRCGNHDIAFQEYERLHEKFPGNEECKSMSKISYVLSSSRLTHTLYQTYPL